MSWWSTYFAHILFFSSNSRLQNPAAEPNPSSPFADSIVELPATQRLRIFLTLPGIV
jgi:hypothetical protein